MNRVGIEPALLGWAKNRSGRSTEFFQQRFPKFDSWERGETLLTFKQLEDFAKATYTPIGFFFLDKPPVEKLPITDFRTMGDTAIRHPSPSLLDTIYQCQNRQDWYKEEARSLGEPPLEFIGCLDTSVDVSTAGALLRNALAFDIEERRQSPTWTEALRQFINQADALGILVMVSSIVGSNTSRRLDFKEFRGLALSDSWAPLVFINGADTKAAQMFTLAHEIAHLWIGESGISDSHMTANTDHAIERWCNNVAAELLVPSQMILHEFDPHAKLMVETKRLARRFKVSTLVALRRIHDAGCISWDEFRAAFQEESRRLQEIPRSSGGSPINNVSARAGTRLARALIVSVLEGRTTYSEAFRLLGLKKLSTFERIVESLEVQSETPCLRRGQLVSDGEPSHGRGDSMLGKRSDQRGLFEADHLHLDLVGRDSFYGRLAGLRGQLFRDEDFAALYCRDNGRSSVPPSLLATALLLQAHDKVSDAEAHRRATVDLSWKVALGVEVEVRPFAQSTLQHFRAQLVLHAQMRELFRRSLELARTRGLLRGRSLQVALDTTPIWGRGAVKDTYNLLADGIRQLLRTLARVQDRELVPWATGQGYARYLAASVKGTAEIDWDQPTAREAFLAEIVADADRLLATARHAQAGCAADSPDRDRIVAAAQLLGPLLHQDVARPATGVRLKQGVSRDRIVSVHDPEMRHGRKSSSQRFDGHKAAVAVDPESQLITAVAVLPGNAPDAQGALQLVAQSEQHTGLPVTAAMADTAYGDGHTRQQFADAGRTLIAKVRKPPTRPHFPKEDFQIDLAAGTCTCPAGQVTRTVRRHGFYATATGAQAPRRSFHFDAALCTACPLRPRGVAAAPGRGRQVSLHPQEALLQAARTFQQSAAFAPYRHLRQAVEHRLARLVQLGLRQARYLGRHKTAAQLYLTATVANLTRILAAT